ASSAFRKSLTICSGFFRFIEFGSFLGRSTLILLGHIFQSRSHLGFDAERKAIHALVETDVGKDRVSTGSTHNSIILSCPA
ncbi:MAG: hypothetical protein ACOYYF_15965, partial [Chloroflexota bacterium]